VARAGGAGSIGAARVLLATSFGLASACWPFDDADRDVATVDRIDLLSPRGRLDQPPRFIRWSTTRAGVRFRVRVVDRSGRLLFERPADEGRTRALQLTACERSAWEDGRPCRIEVDLAAADGELLAASDAVAAWVGNPARSLGRDRSR
jgi:hypothetical protein